MNKFILFCSRFALSLSAIRRFLNMNGQFPSILLEKAVNEFAKLPGVGRKTAMRLVLHLLRQDAAVVEAFGNAIVTLKHEVKYCKVCHNISDTEPYECQEQHGSHINEDHFYPEIINPETLERLPNGEVGELVFTTLTKEGMPLLRYRTKDLTSLMEGECPCGRTNIRMSGIVGRSDDMLIIRGINVFPSQVESVILDMPQFEPQYMLVVDRKNNLDSLQVQVEVRKDFFSDDMGRMLAMKKALSDKLKSVLSISAEVKLMEPNSIARSEGKSKRVIDNRILK